MPSSSQKPNASQLLATLGRPNETRGDVPAATPDAGGMLSSLPDRINAAIYPASLGAIRDVANRAVVNLVGAPVDAAGMLANTAIAAGGFAGHQLGVLDTPPNLIQKPVGGSEWLGQQLEDARIVSPQRRPAAEFLAGLAVPSVGVAGAKGLAALSEMSPAIAPSAGSRSFDAAAQLGAISPEGKARLLADLQAGKGSGTYRLGDLTEGQAAGVNQLFGRPTAGRNVYMTDDGTSHLIERRMQDQGFSAEEVAQFAENAMAKRARADLNVAKGDQNPSLLNSGVKDPATGRVYSARMPFRQVEDGYEVRSVVPEGLPGRNNKAPKR